MTGEKAQKRAIRTRMAKTGERYTSARLYALDLHHDQPKDGPTEGNEPSSPLVQLPVREETNRDVDPGVSDAAILRGTGKDWNAWLALLDAWGAAQRTHAEIARHVQETYGISGWWAQGVSVGYERLRGLRATYQHADGYSVGVSKTIPVSVARAYAAVADERQRAGWIDGLQLRWRGGQPDRSAHFDVLPGDSRLTIGFIARGAEKTTVQLQHERLKHAEDVEEWRAIWKARLGGLAVCVDERCVWMMGIRRTTWLRADS